MDREVVGCVHLKCVPTKCRCSLGKKLGLAQDGSMDVRSILQGATPEVCKGCRDYEELRVYDYHTIGVTATGDYGVVVTPRR